MSSRLSGRRLRHDWYDGLVPANVVIDDTAYIETSYSFIEHRSRAVESVRIGRAASVYEGTMFDLGPRAQVTIGAYVLINGARIICDGEIQIGDYSLVSWNVLIMDSYRASLDVVGRREELSRAAMSRHREEAATRAARRIEISRNVWIGFDVCILPGVTIGEGAIIGARSVVMANVPAFAVVAGNPAKIVRLIKNDEARDG